MIHVILSSKRINMILFIIMVSMSFPVHTKLRFSNGTITEILKSVVTFISIYFIFNRFYTEYKEKKTSLHITEKIMIAYALAAIMSLIVVMKISFLNIFHPVVALIIFLGISSFFKTHRIIKSDLLVLLHLFVAMALLHLAYNSIINIDRFPQLIINSFKTESYLTNSGYFLGFTDNPNVFAIQMMLGAFSSFAILSYFLINHTLKYWHFIYLLLLSVFLLSTVMSASRASVLGILVYVTATFLIYYKKIFYILKEKKLIYPVAIIITIIIILLFTFIDQLVYNFIAKFSHGTSTRSKMWMDLINYQVSHFPTREFFFGYGFEEFKFVNFTDVDGFKQYKHIHNLFLETWGREGLISLITISALFFTAIYRNIRHNKNYWYISMIPVAFIMHNCFEVVLVTRIIRWEVFFFYIILLFPVFALDSLDGSS